MAVKEQMDGGIEAGKEVILLKRPTQIRDYWLGLLGRVNPIMRHQIKRVLIAPEQQKV